MKYIYQIIIYIYFLFKVENVMASIVTLNTFLDQVYLQNVETN